MQKRQWWLIAIGGLLALTLLALLIAGPLLAPMARRDLVRSLGEAASSDVSIRTVSVAITPEIRITAEDLIFKYSGRTDTPPLIQLRKLTMYAGWFSLFGKPRRFRRVNLDGFEVTIPPDRNRGRSRPQSGENQTVIDRLTATGSVLHVLPSEPGHETLTFEFSRVELSGLDPKRATDYNADLKLPKPPGLVHISGQFGPSHPGGVGSTPVSGKYRFEKANLGVFSAIAGTLSSTGAFHGTLNHIDATGAADVPDFTLHVGEHPFPVHVDFSATVDGMNGNTLLHPVTAHLLHSTIVASGEVVSKPGQKGKTVTLNAVVRPGRIEDLLWITNKGREPFMSGPTTMRAKVVLPPGPRHFLDKVQVAGTFGIGSAQYNRADVQRNVDRLSERAHGDPKPSGDDTVSSEIHGACTVEGGAVHVSVLHFHVSGALARVAGTYGLHDHALNMKGSLFTEAKASQMTTGWKSALLKVVDPFLKRKNAGAEIPIRVTGTREHPNFAVRKLP